MSSKSLAIALAAAIVLMSGAARAFELAALTDGNQLVFFSDRDLRQTRGVAITGTSARIVGIDVRPADDQLYGVAADGNIYRLSANGGATLVSKISAPFDAAQGIVVDFNPVADRLRLIAGGGSVNLRINVDNGQAAVDKPLVYKPGDANSGRTPMVRAGAYINSLKGAKETQLFDIDSGTGGYVIQDPPNDGVLTTIGATGLAGTRIDAIDIHTDAQGEYTGFAVANMNTLYRLDVARGILTPRGTVAFPATLVDIAVLRP